MDGSGLTPRQRDVLGVVLNTLREEGCVPSVREIAAALGLRSPGTVNKHVRALLARGALVRRGGRLAPAPSLVPATQGIPVVGQVAAGRPVDAPEHREGEVSLSGLFGGEGLFAVRVRGDSMEDAGILEGDLVVVRPADRAAPGQIVLAYVGPDQEATVKVFRRGPGGGAVLEPRNARHAPIVVENDPDFRIGGAVVGVVRRLPAARAST